MKTVFTNDMCAHVWAQLSQEHGRSGSMHFDGPVACSYRTPVAHIVDGAAGKVALFTSRTYSMTTSSKHMPAYRSAARHLPSFTVPDLLLPPLAGRLFHKTNLDHFRGLYDLEVAQLMRVPCDSWRVADLDGSHGAAIEAEAATIPQTRAHDALFTRFHAAVRYAEAFGLPVPAYNWWTDAAAIIARRDRLANDPKRAAKREAGRVAREKAEARKAEIARERNRIALLDAAERVTMWRAGADVSLRYLDVPRDAGDILRIRGDAVQTSRGAECPLSYAVPALQFWRRTVDACLTYTRADCAPGSRAVRLGQFTLDVIEYSGDVRAGCHTIKRAELEALERTLADRVPA